MGHAIVRNESLYTHISTNTTTLVTTGRGTLHTIVLNTTSAGAITIYDGVSAGGAVIAILKASVAEQTFIYDVVFSAGLCIVTAGASDLTVSWTKP